MKKIFYLFGLALLSAFMSCSSSDDGTNDVTDTGLRPRQLTIENVGLTRATLKEHNDALEAKWTAGDKATCVNLSWVSQSDLTYSDLAALSSDVTSKFSGEVTCKQNDNLLIIYPALSAKPTISSYTPEGKDYALNRLVYPISLKGQDGTLETIATKFHQVYGTARVESVTDKTATAHIKEMHSILSVCKFKFTDQEGVSIPVKSLQITYGEKYPINANVFVDEMDEDPSDFEESQSEDTDIDSSTEYAINLDIDYINQEPLTINLNNETSDGVYVALMPGGEWGEDDSINTDDTPVTLYFTVTSSKGTYTGTAKAILESGDYINVTLKLSK